MQQDLILILSACTSTNSSQMVSTACGVHYSAQTEAINSFSWSCTAACRTKKDLNLLFKDWAAASTYCRSHIWRICKISRDNQGQFKLLEWLKHTSNYIYLKVWSSRFSAVLSWSHKVTLQYKNSFSDRFSISCLNWNSVYLLVLKGFPDLWAFQLIVKLIHGGVRQIVTILFPVQRLENLLFQPHSLRWKRTPRREGSVSSLFLPSAWLYRRVRHPRAADKWVRLRNLCKVSAVTLKGSRASGSQLHCRKWNLSKEGDVLVFFVRRITAT